MCQDLDMLAAQYDAELEAYSAAGRYAAHAVGTDLSEAFKRADRARLAFENARDRMNQHIRSHHCLESTDVEAALSSSAKYFPRR